MIWNGTNDELVPPASSFDLATAPIGLVEQADANVVEAALKTDEGFHRQSPKTIVAAIIDVVAREKSFVVLLDAVAVDRIVEE